MVGDRKQYRKFAKKHLTGLSVALICLVFMSVFLIVLISVALTQDATGIEPAMAIISVITAIPLVFTVLILKKYIVARRIIDFGTEGTAEYISSGSNVRINDVPYFKMEYSYYSDGVLCTGTTGSIFTYQDISAFEQAKTFRVLYLKDKSVVIDDRRTLELRLGPIAPKVQEAAQISGDAQDALFTVLSKELDKEPTYAAMLALIDEHKSTVSDKTIGRLTARARYICSVRAEQASQNNIATATSNDTEKTSDENSAESTDKKKNKWDSFYE